MSPGDERTFAYRYQCDRADGDFKQIRITQVHYYGDASSRTGVVYSRDFAGEMPVVSGWMDRDTLICFIKEEPYRLKASFDEPVRPENGSRANMHHYPEDGKRYLVRGLGGRTEVLLPSSNFAQDGRSYLVYSARQNSILQKDLTGNEVGRTELPSTVKYYDKELSFSLDGQHIAFIGYVNGPSGNVRAIYVADVK